MLVLSRRPEQNWSRLPPLLLTRSQHRRCATLGWNVQRAVVPDGVALQLFLLSARQPVNAESMEKASAGPATN